MMDKPALTEGYPAITNRYEDFLATHIAEADFVHYVVSFCHDRNVSLVIPVLTNSQGVFYPFHRFLVSLYEKELWACGWNSSLGQPYWDWTIDAQSPEYFFSSPLFDNTTGFGGNGAYIPGNFSDPEPGLVRPVLRRCPCSAKADHVL